MLQPYEQSVLAACKSNGPLLTGLLTHNGAAVDGATLLWAISGIESSHGRDRLHARQESNYSPGGLFYARSVDLQQSWKTHGVLAACSFGSWQVLYQVARELGFKGQPEELKDDRICCAMATVLILERLIRKQGAKTLTEVLDSFNSGSHRDACVPLAYIRNGTHLYLEGLPYVNS